MNDESAIELAQTRSDLEFATDSPTKTLTVFAPKSEGRRDAAGKADKILHQALVDNPQRILRLFRKRSRAEFAVEVEEAFMFRRRTLMAGGVWLALGAASAMAQQPSPRPVPMRPPLFLSESWKSLPTPPDDHNAWPAAQGGVANPHLDLTLYGTTAKEIQLVAGRAGSDTVPANLWTGTTTSPSAAALRDRNNFVDLSAPLSKIRWVVRTSGFHQAWPIVKLADGTWLVGDRPSGLQADFNEIEITPTDLRWLKLDIERVVTVGTWIDHPDLKKVDSVGFADLMPGSGHGSGGYINVGRIEVYGTPVKR